MSTAIPSSAAGNVYRRLLGRRGVASLVSGFFLVGTSIATAALSLVFLVRATTGSIAAAGAASAAFGLFGALLAPLRSRAVDRLGQPAVLIPLTAGFVLALAGAIVLALAGAEAGFLVGVAALAGASVPPVGAALRASWRDVTVGSQELQAAYALDNVLQEGYLALASLLTGGLLVIGSPSAAVAGAATLAVCGTGLFSASPVSRAWRSSGGTASPISVIPSRGRGMLVLAVSVFGLGLALGALEIGVVAFALGHGSDAYAGPMLALLPLGSVVGGLWYGGRAWPGRLGGRYAVLSSLLAVSLLLLSLAGSVPQLAVGVFVSGLVIAPAWTCLYGLLDSVSPPGAEAEAYGWLAMSNNLGLATGVGLAGALSDWGSPRSALLLAAGSAAGAALVAWVGGRGLSSFVAVPD